MNKNPFKMWGPWIGAIAFPFVATYLGWTSYIKMYHPPAEIGMAFPYITLITWLPLMIIGFLVGWFVQVKVMKK